jgi:hypothetical protein
MTNFLSEGKGTLTGRAIVQTSNLKIEDKLARKCNLSFRRRDFPINWPFDWPFSIKPSSAFNSKILLQVVNSSKKCLQRI